MGTVHIWFERADGTDDDLSTIYETAISSQEVQDALDLLPEGSLPRRIEVDQ